MKDDVEIAERLVTESLARLTNDVGDLKGLLKGHMVWHPSVSFKAAFSKTQKQEGTLLRDCLSIFRGNPVPSILIAVGLGWLVGQHVLRGRTRQTGGKP